MTNRAIHNKILKKKSINFTFKKKKDLSIKKNIVISKKKRAQIKHVSLYKKVLGALTKKGKKNLAKKALNDSLYVASKIYKIPSYKIITKILGRLRCHAEIKKVTKRKMTTLIPFPISKARQKFLKVKWFLHGAKENKSKISFSHKLLKEIETNFEKKKYLKSQRTIMNKLLIKNISNAHFRWVSR